MNKTAMSKAAIDTVKIIPNSPPDDFIYAPPQIIPNIIFKDNDILIVSKPAGLLSVAGRGEDLKDCLVSRVQKDICADARIVHRLDMDTSGIMIFARTPAALKHIGRQFEKRAVNKVYRAHVHGIVKGARGEVDLPLRCDWENRPKQMVDFEQGKQSLTRWEINDTNETQQYTRLALFPHTGRSHQLRVHCLYMGHPIIGDKFYGAQGKKIADRLFLHAESIEFYHPVTNERVTFKDDCPF